MINVWQKGDRRVDIQEDDQSIVGFIGPKVTINEVTTENGWENLGSVVHNPNLDATPIFNPNSELYHAFRTSGYSRVDSVRLSGYNPGD